MNPLSRPCTRLFLLTTLVLTVPGGWNAASAASLGAFQISARGDQKLNLSTGQTELPQGGTATDSKSGLTLTGKTLKYLPGRSLQATGAAVRVAAGGTLTADTVNYDVKSGTLTASGHLTYTSAHIRGLSAGNVVLYTASEAVVASGNVRAASPALSASRVVVLNGGAQILLAGNYTLNTGSSRLADPSASARLLLNTKGGQGVTPRPTQAALRAFVPYLK
ncbi:hypothetical protein Q0M94_14215 [Deinococcus radiomollis]|uniref:hypothetical protein n=1 Tax=Deinococcus radiomollis TaxID=468916 RepID=UPI003892111F